MRFRIQDRTVIENTLIRLDLNASTMADRYTEVHKLSITIEQMICTALGLLILSSDGKVYVIGYTDPEPVSLRYLRIRSCTRTYQMLLFFFLLRPSEFSRVFRLFWFRKLVLWQVHVSVLS